MAQQLAQQLAQSAGSRSQRAKVTSEEGAQVTVGTTAGKHGGNVNMFTRQRGKVFAQGHRGRAEQASSVGPFNTCKALLTGGGCICAGHITHCR